MKKIMSLVLVTMMTACLASCGGQAQKSNETQKEGSAVVTENTEGTVKVALVGPMTGPNQEYGLGFQYAAQAAVDQVNEAGGIEGKKVEMKVFDNKGTGEEGMAIAQLIAGEGDYIGVVGHFGDTMVIGKTYEEAGVCYISPAASSMGFTDQGEHIFRLNATIDTETKAMFTCVDKVNAKKLGIVALNDDWGTKASDVLKEALAEDNPKGYEIVDTEPVLGGDMDYTSVISNLKNAGAEVAVMFCYYDTVVPFSITAKKMYPDLKIVCCGNIYNDTFLEVGGEEVNGVMCPSLFDINGDDKKVQDFIERYKKISGGANPSFLSGQAYDAMNILLDAAKATKGEIDRPAIREFIANEKHLGVTGDCSFNENRDAVRNFFPVMVKDGKWGRP